MCGCKSGKSGAPLLWNVKMPNGTIKPYSSDIAAKAMHQQTPGSILIPPAGVSV